MQIKYIMSLKEEKEKLAIITAFMNYTLENDHFPKSVFKFCKDNNTEEKNFYKFFGSLDGVKGIIWDPYSLSLSVSLFSLFLSFFLSLSLSLPLSLYIYIYIYIYIFFFCGGGTVHDILRHV